MTWICNVLWVTGSWIVFAAIIRLVETYLFMGITLSFEALLTIASLLTIGLSDLYLNKK